MAASFAVLALTGCSDVSPPVSCPTGKIEVTEVELFFGRDVGRVERVSDRDWQTFLDEEITPRFPRGLTIEDATGQWSDSEGIVHERSKRLTIVLKRTAADETKLSEIRSAYRERFHQDSVLLVEKAACATF
jgi:hypothetical protein